MTSEQLGPEANECVTLKLSGKIMVFLASITCVCGLLFLGIGILLDLRVAIGVGVFCLAGTAYQLLELRPGVSLLTLDEGGMLVKTGSTSTRFSWTEVDRFEAVRAGAGHSLVLFTAPERFHSKTVASTRSFDFPAAQEGRNAYLRKEYEVPAPRLAGVLQEWRDAHVRL